MALSFSTRQLGLLLAAFWMLSAAKADLEALLSSQIDPAVADPSWTIPVVDVPTNPAAFTADDLQGLIPPNPQVPPDACNATSSRMSRDRSLYGSRRLQSMPRSKPVNRRLLGPPRITVDYNGGPILQTVNVYLLYVQADNDTDWSWTALPNFFVSNLQNSSRWQLMTTLYMINTSGNKVYYQGNLNLTVAAQITLPAGTAIKDGISCGQGANNTVDNFANLVGNAIDKGVVPLDPNGLYLLVPNLDSGVLASYGSCGLLGPTDKGNCGWHTSTNFTANDNSTITIAYGYVPYATTCGCGLDDPSVFSIAAPPSGDVWVDGFVDTILHELEEAISDPYYFAPAWSALNDPNNQGEIGDVCTADLKPVFNTTVKGTQVVYNMVVGGVPFVAHNGYDTNTKMCEAALPA